MTVYKKCRISCAHSLNLPYQSPCNRLHGHNYTVEVWIAGEPDTHGMVADFALVKAAVSAYDHRLLNDLISPATVEIFATHLRCRLEERFPGRRVRVRVWETEDCYAEVGGDTA